MKFKKLNIIILAAALIGVLAWVVHEDGLDNLLNMFAMLNPVWLVFAVLFMVFYWLLEGIVLHDIVKSFHHQQKLSHSLQTSMIGQLFNCLTPFSSGGQPVQAFHMKRTGVPLGIASGSLMIKFIVYQFCLTVYSIVVLLFFWQPLSQQVSGFGYLVFIGFAVNFGVMLGLLCICFFRGFTEKLVKGLVRILAKIHIVKDKEKTLSYVDGELEAFHKSFVDIKTHKWMVIRASVLSFVQLTVYFMIPYFICLAFGIRGISVLMVVSAQAFVVMISSFVPLPGAAGGAEFSFKTFFSPFFSPYHISVNPAMLLWRFITFYLPIIVGTCFMAASPKPTEENAHVEMVDNSAGKPQLEKDGER